MLDHIEFLVVSGNLTDALKTLYESSREAPFSSIRDEIIQLMGRNSQNEKQIRAGVITQADASIERSRITQALLHHLEQLRGSGASGPVVQVTQMPPGKSEPEPEPDPEPTVEADKKQILFISANPSNEDGLQTDREFRLIQDRMARAKERDRFEFLNPVLAATIDELLVAIDTEPEIIHFAGHGSAEGILITNDDNTAKLLPVVALVGLLEQLQGTTELVVFNACYSSHQVEEVSRLGMYVIGFRFELSDDAAVSFVSGLYLSLGQGKDIETAVKRARIKVMVDFPDDEFNIEFWKDGERLKV